MRFGKRIYDIRKSHGLTQEEFANMFSVTRQAVSNWENDKAYPDLHTLVGISDKFNITLDVLLKEDERMIESIDRERISGGEVERERTIIDSFTGAGTGILLSCVWAAESVQKIIVLIIGLGLISIGWYKKYKYDKKILEYVEREER